MLIKCTSKELDMMARLMRSEALSDGNIGMILVGDVIINRALANCYTFKNIRTIEDVIKQSPGGFSGVKSSLYIGSSTTKEKELAKKCLKGDLRHPAEHALWFYAPKKSEDCKNTWYDQNLAGKFKSHCFYEPEKDICHEVY